MPHRIEVILKPGIKEALGETIAHRIRKHLGKEVERINTVEVYTISEDLPSGMLELFAKEALCDPIVQNAMVNKSTALERDFHWAVDVAYRPGVTDNVGRTAREALALLMELPVDQVPSVHHSRQYLIKCHPDHVLSALDVESIANDLLGNKLIQSFSVYDRSTIKEMKKIQPKAPKILESTDVFTENIDLDVSDEELLRLSRERVLALSLEEMKQIQAHYRRPEVMEIRRHKGLQTRDGEATDVELECLAQTWSEHCKHKIFNADITYTDEEGRTEKISSLFKTYIQGATKEVRRAAGEDDICLSVFKDNAGVVKLDDEWSLVFKVETHNSPSALDPYGGALTGIVGVNRDPFGTGKGASLIFNTDVFCLASPHRRKELPPRLLQPLRVLEGVREGVEHGGNKSGIPTVNGAVVFDERYLGKPLVFCGTGGLMPAEINGKPSHEKAACNGDYIVMVGGRIGKDGIHGATFSSEEFHEGSPATAVQIGDPITQKRMFDMLLQARDKGLYTAITDNGAGGLSSSVGEMAEDPGGADLDLGKAPLKYSSLQPWEILVSEAQERMTLAVSADKIESFMELARRFSVEATILGTFNDSGYFTVRYNENVVGHLPMEFLHGGLPPMKLTARFDPAPESDPSSEELWLSAENTTGSWNRVLLEMLSRYNICSKEYWIRQYDHEVQGGSVVKPLTGAHDDGPSDAAVLRPLLGSMKAIVVSCGICPRYSDIDTYHMAACALDEAIRNAVCVGADPSRLSALDNFCWSDPIKSPQNPQGPHKLAQLVRANKALYDLCIAYGVPLISGKDSMKNDYRSGDIRISVPATLLVSVLGIMEDGRKAVTSDAKKPGDVVYILGQTRCELGGSEFLATKNRVGCSVPKVRPQETVPRYKALHKAITAGLLRSCHDASDGGLAVCLAETSLGGDLGMDIDLSKAPVQRPGGSDLPPEVMLFSESQGRFVLTAEPDKTEELENILAPHGLSRVGLVTDDSIFKMRTTNDKVLINLPVSDIRQAFKEALSSERF